MQLSMNQKETESIIQEERRLLEIENKLQGLEDKIDILQGSVTNLLAAWNAANWLVNFIKWVGGLAVAVTAIVALLKGGK